MNRLASLKSAALSLILDDDNRYLLLLFIIGFSIRSIPNLLTPFPIGYDTIDYANTMLNFRFDFRYLLNFQTPLFIFIASVLSTLSSAHPFIVLRFLQPILYGLLVTSYYYATRRIYQWNKKWVIFSALIFCLQPTSLRLSWDLLRNELGLTLLLFTLPKIANPRKSHSLILLPILVVLSHELTSVLLFVIVVGLVFRDIYYANLSSAKILFLSILPSMIIFLSVFFFGSLIPNVTANIVNNNTLPVNQTTTFPFVDYLSGEWTVDYEGSYLYLVLDVFSVFLASFLPLLPFLIKKLTNYTPTRDVNSIDLWAGFCAIAFLNCLVSPTFALLAWHRWMFLLIIPYSLYAVEGIMAVSEKKMLNISFRTIIAVITCSIYLALAILYLSSSYTNPLSLSEFINPASKYLPTTMLRHTTPIEDTLSITQAFQWINQHFTNQTCILVGDAFIDWAKLNVNTEIPTINYRNKKVNEGLSFAQSLNYSEIYWLWWDNGVGLDWYGQSIPEVFTPVFQVDNMVVYKYSSSN